MFTDGNNAVVILCIWLKDSGSSSSRDCDGGNRASSESVADDNGRCEVTYGGAS